jgi:hypothetical protein
MSSDSDFERLLREARQALPEPAGDVTERARRQALAAARKRRSRRARRAAASVAGIAVALVLGIGIGALVTPSGHAAKGPVGLGFLPAPGWTAFQTGGEASIIYQTVAVASNVPLDPEDQVAGAANASGLPYTTLVNLPSSGIVIVAMFTRRDRSSPYRDRLFPARKLPLRLSDGTAFIQNRASVRIDDPLGQIQVRASVAGHDVEVDVHFGTAHPSRALLAAAQRQVDRLVVQREAIPTTRARIVAQAPRAIDRTLACSTALVGGIYQVEARAHSGVRSGASRWTKLPFAVASTGNPQGGRNDPALLANSLAWITAGQPSSTTTMDLEWRTLPVRSSGTLGLRSSACKQTSAKVPLTSRGLRGGVAPKIGQRLTCDGPRRVLVRVRATLRPPGTVTAARGFLRTQATVRAAELAVRTPAGKQLIYATVAESGQAHLFTAPTCEQS